MYLLQDKINNFVTRRFPMNSSIVIGLIQNTAILLAFGMLYDYIWIKSGTIHSLWGKLFIGIIIGGFGIVLMLTPWTLVPGLVFDTRSVMLSISGLFFGPFPTLIAMLVTGGFRIFMGGSGLYMGLAVIVTSGGIGILWGYLRPTWKKHYLIELLVLGLIVHLFMLGCTIFLPAGVTIPTLKTIAFPVMIIYPVGTLLLGILLLKRTWNYEVRQALIVSEERWKFALEGAGDGVWDWNIKEDTIYYSPRFISMLGFQPEELKQEIAEWEQRIHPDDKNHVMKELKAYTDGLTDLYNPTYRLRCKDGTYKWILDRGKIMQWDDQGYPERMIGTHTDITYQKKSEEELLMAKQKAEESDRLKMAFLNNISHEIRTPMNAIMGFTELLREPGMEGDQERFLSIINTNANQLLTIIDDVLMVSRLDSEKVPLEPAPFSLTALLEDLRGSFSTQIEQKGLAFSVESDPDEETDLIMGDQFRIRQILSCFLSNALKYTQEGSIDLHCKREGERLIFRVMDTGIGVDENSREKIFERFYRAPEVTNTTAGGTGLGLSIAQELAWRMNGSVGLNPRQERGSEFFLSIPWIPVEGTVEKPSSVFPADIHTWTLLIAEDDPTNVEFMRVIFEKRVKKLFIAWDGMEAVSLADSALPDIILMDLKMPRMDGYEAIRKIRSHHPHIPIIALTAYSRPEEKKLAAEAGCTAFLTKPVQKQRLMEVLVNVAVKKCE